MNKHLDFIFTRRSIRKFLNKPVPESALNDLLQAAMAAPSARATDPWHFVVITERDMLNRMTAALPNGKMLLTATAAIVACGDMNRALEGFESYMLQDVSAAVENILLAANAMGLGACWLGIHPRRSRMEGIRTLLALPEHVVPVAGIALGYADGKVEARTRYREECVHRDTW